jgi:hypothetical protein
VSAKGEKLSRKKEQFIAELLARPTRGQAAEAVGISSATADRWLRDPEFAAEYRAARHRVLDQAVTTLHQLLTHAAVALGRNLTCGNPAGEIRAACAILENAIRGAELLDVEGRLAEVEAQLKEVRANVPQGAPGPGRPFPAPGAPRAG